MRQMKATRPKKAHLLHSPLESRVIPRSPVSFGLMYSGIDGQDVLIGDGSVLNLSKGGLGITGNQPVQVGMDLALFLYLPDGEDPLFVLEARVAWTNGRRFGVEFTKVSLRDGNRLHAFLRAQSLQCA
ncbi:MAG: PilZ domain-containing protein [Nitrospiraceae bacterium]